MRAVSLLMLWGALVLAGCASGQTATPMTFTGQLQPQERKIEVVGEAEVKVVPDEFVIDATVSAFHAQLDQARGNHDATMRAVMQAVRAIGIAPKYIVTDDISINPRYHGSTFHGDHKRVGYEVSKGLKVILHKPEQLEPVLTALVDQGVDRIHSVSFGSQDLQAHQERAQLEALEKAKTKATKMAASLGQELGEPMLIEETGERGRQVGNFVYTAAVPDAGQTLGLGKLRVSSRLKVVFALRVR